MMLLFYTSDGKRELRYNIEKGGNLMYDVKKMKQFDVPFTPMERLYTRLTLLIWGVLVIYIAMVWQNIPIEIPLHYNALGELDSTGSKWTMLTIPIVTYCFWSLMNFMMKHPEWGNYPARLNEQNAEAFYTHNRKLIVVLRNGGSLFFAFVLAEMVFVSLGIMASQGITIYATLLSIFVILPLAIGVIQSRKIQ